GSSHRHHELAFLEMVRVADRREGNGRGVARKLEPEEREIEILVAADDLRRERSAVLKKATHARRLLDDVPVREDLSGGGDDHAAPGHVPRASLAAIVGLLDDLDEDERWEDRILRSLDHGSEIRQLRIALGRARRANWSQRLIGTAKSR